MHYGMHAKPREFFLMLWGLQTGLFTMLLVVAFGLQQFFRYYPEAFFGLKILGCSYLMFLGIKAMLEVHKKQNTKNAQKDEMPTSRLNKFASHPWIQGFLVDFTNAKGVLFFAVFLPPFLQAFPFGLYTNTLLLSSCVVVVDVLVMFCYFYFARKLRQFLQASYWFQISLGGILVFLGIYLYLTTPNSFVV